LYPHNTGPCGTKIWVTVLLKKGGQQEEKTGNFLNHECI